MSKPTEDLRALLNRAHDAIGVGVSVANLRSVVEAAERFEALELAHNPSKKGETILIRYWDDEARTWKVCSSSLAALADKLRKIQ